MKQLFACVFGVLLFSAAQAELQFPVDPEGPWVAIDTTDCSTVGPVPRSFPTADGSDPGWGPQFKFLRYRLLGAQPDYDGNLRKLSTPYILCGPDVNTCYDTSTAHEDGVGCSTTDEFKQIAVLQDLSQANQLLNVRNRAARAIVESISNNQRDLAVQLFSVLLGVLVDGSTLPTNYQGVNFQKVYETINGSLDQPPYNELLPDMRTPTQDAFVRLKELTERVKDGTIQDGEIDDPLGWPPVAVE